MQAERARQDPEIIEILSDSDDDMVGLPNEYLNNAFQMDDDVLLDGNAEEWAAALRAVDEADAAEFPRDIASLTASEERNMASDSVTTNESVRIQQILLPLTEDECLAKVLEIYPDIAHDHVRHMYRSGIEQGIPADSSFGERLIVRILDKGKYPKERDCRNNLKRKRQPSSVEIPEPVWEEHGDAETRYYKQEAQAVLSYNFPQVPIKFIADILRHEKYLYKAYLVLEEVERTYDTDQNQGYKRVRKRDTLHYREPTMPHILRELEAARRKTQSDAVKRSEEEEVRKVEQENERISRVHGNIAECGCCFSEHPTNRMTYCNGRELHLFCYGCLQNYINAEIGQGKCRPKCMDTGGCSADFSRAQLMSSLDERTFETLERLQQQEDLRLAGLDDMAECPFCDFKMICLPKEIDREFRCQHPDCRIVSCRLCQSESHIPLTCEQAAKEKKVDVRHLVEEAMTAALIRACNKCKNKFVKEIGCNKMMCPVCGNIQCYVCSKDVRNYEHFANKPGQCPLYDNTDARHEDDVKKAEQAALENIKKEHPELKEEELKVEVSEAVRKAEEQRIRQGAARVPPVYGQPRRVPPPMGHVVGHPIAVPAPFGMPVRFELEGHGHARPAPQGHPVMVGQVNQAVAPMMAAGQAVQDFRMMGMQAHHQWIDLQHQVPIMDEEGVIYYFNPHPIPQAAQPAAPPQQENAAPLPIVYQYPLPIEIDNLNRPAAAPPAQPHQPAQPAPVAGPARAAARAAGTAYANRPAPAARIALPAAAPLLQGHERIPNVRGRARVDARHPGHGQRLEEHWREAADRAHRR